MNQTGKECSSENLARDLTGAKPALKEPVSITQPNHLNDILRDLVLNNVKFIIAGGVAVVLHGVERVTMDIDISLEFTKRNIERFIQVMKHQHMVPRVPVPPEVLLDQDAVQMMVQEKHAVVFTFIDIDMPLKHVDVFLQDELSYQNLLPDAMEMDVFDYKVCALTREKLIALKQKVRPVRDKDLFDIKALQELK